jgi:hypothetical protein
MGVKEGGWGGERPGEGRVAPQAYDKGAASVLIMIMQR